MAFLYTRSMNTDYNLKEIVLAAFEELLIATDQQVSIKPTPEKWSAKEILGHLIDSATVNHGRFVRAQNSEDLIGETYAQDQWVAVQEYQMLNWQDILITWRQLNLQIAYLMYITEDEVRDKPRTHHNLDQIAFKTVPENEPTTLGYFMEDYVLHLRHHLGQIRTLLSSKY
jgi:hypothetical protein